MPETKRLIEGVAEVPVEFKTQGVHRIAVTSENDDLEATTNPTLCDEDRNTRVFWGDLHGQSEETIGTGSIDHYFEFARERGFLDFVAPANHDFQMSDDLWERVIEAVSYHHDPCDFVTFLGYEWSSNTPIGGDHNVYFLKEEGELFRSSDWMVADEGSGHTEGTYPVKELYNRFEGRDDVLIIPHQGGRPANLEVLDPERTPFVELLSLWGVFEWFGNEALERGYTVGFVGGSDDVSGRLGATSPELDTGHNVDGGLMAVQAEALTRNHLWNAFKQRRVYATTGARILIDTECDGLSMGQEGRISDDAEFTVNIKGTAPIQQVDLFRGPNRIASKSVS